MITAIIGWSLIILMSVWIWYELMHPYEDSPEKENEKWHEEAEDTRKQN